MRLPGFRPGKAPRRILEARIGIAPARQQALQDAIPRHLADAVKEHDVDIIAPPEVDITAGEDDGPVAFAATVEVRPRSSCRATRDCGSSCRRSPSPTTMSRRR